MPQPVKGLLDINPHPCSVVLSVSSSGAVLPLMTQKKKNYYRVEYFLKLQHFFISIGVQTLMDGVMSYLPSPLEGHELYKCFGEELAGRAFKVIHDDQRGVLTFVRLYSGEMKKAQKIYNLGQDRSEQVRFGVLNS